MTQKESTKIVLDLIKKNNVWLAPMAGITDIAFRILCKEQGCGMTCTEMVSAKGLHYGGNKSRDLLEIHDSEIPAAIQIFGSEPSIMAEQAAWICGEYAGKVALIDINMGCPAPKITTNGEGSALMKKPWHAADIVKAVVKASSVPITVKFRKGWDDNSANAVDFAVRMQEAGAAAVAVHGRTRMQFYSGKADWNIIREVKSAVEIPVIGNGDVFSAADASKMLNETDADAVLVARGAQGNPWIFSQIRSLLDRGSAIPLPNARERIEMALRHASLITKYKGDRAIVEMRKHIAWYVSGLPGSAALRANVSRIDSFDSLETLLNEFTGC